MIEREKVIRGLEACSGGIGSCDNCPYAYKGSMMCDRSSLMRDALELLKRQEPRVLTLEETIALCGEPVWLEEDTLQGSHGAWGVVKGLHEQYKAVNIGGARFTYWPRAKYGISWRCWSARPTEEQRKAAKWDPPKEAGHAKDGPDKAD